MEVTRLPAKLEFEDLAKPNAMKSFLGTRLEPDAEDADMVLIGITEENNTQTRSGAVSVPEYLRKGDFWRSAVTDPDLDIRVDKDLKIIDGGNIVIDGCTHTDELTQFAKKTVFQKTIPVFVGGSDALINPIIDGLAKEEKIAVLHLGAHPLEKMELTGNVDLAHSVEIGVRGTTKISVWNRLTELTASYTFQEKCEELRERVVQIVGNAPIFVSFSADYMDPAYVPCAVNPVAGGPSVQDFFVAVETLLPLLNVKGIGIFDLAPEFDPGEVGLNDMVTAFWKLVMVEARELILKK